MRHAIKAFVTAGLLAGSIVGIDAPAASAMPASSGAIAHEGQGLSVDKVYCGYYGCRRRYYRHGYYRPYGYGYRPYGYGYGYRPYGYGYGPRVGIGIGGVGLGFY